MTTIKFNRAKPGFCGNLWFGVTTVAGNFTGISAEWWLDADRLQPHWGKWYRPQVRLTVLGRCFNVTR